MKIWLIGSITPVNDVAGPLLLYRHFKRFEKEGHELKVICHQSSGFQKGEKWETVKIAHSPIVKLARRIFFRSYLQWIGEEILQYLMYLQVKKEFEKDKPDVIIGTWSDYLLFASYKIAKDFKIPLALICHDDYENQMRSDILNNFWKRRKLGHIYRKANSRLCVAEGMNEEFHKRYGVWGDVLYPIGGDLVADRNWIKEEKDKKVLNFGYFGSISNGAQPLLFFADCLKQSGSILHISSSAFPTDGPFVNHPNIKDSGFFTDREKMVSYIHENIDVCIVAQSFDPEDRIFLETNFPSKLVDMSGMNLPVLVISPEYSSSGRIAIKHPQAFVFINALDKDQINIELSKLSNGEYRALLAKNVSNLNREVFDANHIHQQLEDCLLKISSNK